MGCQSANETGGLRPNSAQAGFGGFGLWPLVSRGFLGAKAGFVGFGLGLLVRQGFFDAKAFFAVVREGVADKPG